MDEHRHGLLSGAGSQSDQWLVQQVAETCPGAGWVGALTGTHCFKIFALEWEHT